MKGAIRLLFFYYLFFLQSIIPHISNDSIVKMLPIRQIPVHSACFQPNPAKNVPNDPPMK